ncbi:Do family serine endopeptidase [Fibrobacterota bacterium]
MQNRFFRLISMFLILTVVPGLVLSGCLGKENRKGGASQAEYESDNLSGSRSDTKPIIPELNAPLKSEKEKSDRVVAVVKSIIPCVVSVHSEKILKVQPHQYFNPFEDFFFFFGDPHGQQPRKKPYKQQGLGSGVVISKQGHILTNNHVVGDADELKVTFSEEQEFEAELVGTDKLSDVAVIKIKNPPKDLPVAPLGDSDKLEVGETVIAIGNPFGYSNTVTSGIISAKGRRVGINSYENYLQTDASINPGNSGGALVNLDGQLIGINTAIASRTGASHGIGFAIPINMAHDIMEDLIGKGSVTRGYLGVYLQAVDENISQALGIKNPKGALVARVIEDSPAQRAGFKEMDLIVKADGKKIKDVNHLRNMVAMLKPGKTIKFHVLRERNKMTLKVKIGIREDEERLENRERETSENYGLTVENISQGHTYQYNLEITSGVVVTDVSIGSPADKSGFKAGDVILSIDKKRVNNVGKFQKILKSSKKDILLIQIDRSGSNMYLGLKIR